MKVIATAAVTKTTITTAAGALINLLRPRDFTFEAQPKLNQGQIRGSHSAAAKPIENVNSI